MVVSLQNYLCYKIENIIANKSVFFLITLLNFNRISEQIKIADSKIKRKSTCFNHEKESKSHTRRHIENIINDVIIEGILWSSVIHWHGTLQTLYKHINWENKKPKVASNIWKFFKKITWICRSWRLVWFLEQQQSHVHFFCYIWWFWHI